MNTQKIIELARKQGPARQKDKRGIFVLTTLCYSDGGHIDSLRGIFNSISSAEQYVNEFEGRGFNFQPAKAKREHNHLKLILISEQQSFIGRDDCGYYYIWEKT